MTIDSIAPIGAMVQPAEIVPTVKVDEPAPGFGAWMTSGVNAVNDQLVSADHEVQALAAGEGQSLHQVMIDLEQSRLSFQLLVQVRNRLLEAYQDVMRMQV